MEEQNWYDYFLENLYDLFPKKAQLTQELMDLLCLEREAVYRRLRKDVIFHAHEIVKIVTTWNISLDEIIGINSGKIPFQMQALNYLNPSKKEYANLQKRVRVLDFMKTDPTSEYMEVCNRFPRPLSIGFLTVYRFGIFNWAYQYNLDEVSKQFSKIIIPDKIYQEFLTYKKSIVCAKNSHFIMDPNLFEYSVHSINYFHSILLVTDEEKKLLKEELHALLDYMQEIANRGCYPESGNKVHLYLSKISIDSNYSYIYSEKLKACRIHAFGQHDISSSNSDMITDFRKWMNLKKRTSIQISETNEKQRIEFFAQQRVIVDSL
jgi:hypothetical protein